MKSYDLRARSAALGVRLTRDEAMLLHQEAGRLLSLSQRAAIPRGGVLTKEEFLVSRKKFVRFARKRQDDEMEREAMLATIEAPAQATWYSQHLFHWIGIAGTVSWAIAGTQAAGEAGMHLIGCSLVGCISAMGGGTVNNLLFGDARQGVNWVKNPHHTLMVALAASCLTFYTWPLICHHFAEQKLSFIQASAYENSWMRRIWRSRDLDDARFITKGMFVKACRDERFFQDVHRLLAPRGTLELSPEKAFDQIDQDGNGVLDTTDLERLVQLEYDGSTMRYMLDTVSVAASSVTGTASAVSRGLHPLVCVCSSVTLCFGGILRDLICRREVALGSQSFAVCTATGAAVYVSLRELCIRGIPVPLGLRILFSGGTTILLRLVSFYSEVPLLKPMFDDGQLEGEQAAA